ncbi:MAG: hypothetical protein NDI90_21750 [Nitrospira sp. BO4]|nr:hypothetical protein [Nitrospira sp. BO4]
MHRSYPVRKRGRSQISPVTSIRFSRSVHERLDTIHALLASRWGVADKPSLSLLLEGVIVRWADSMRDDPTAIDELIAEIEVRGGARGVRNQFQLDGEAFKRERANDHV